MSLPLCLKLRKFYQYNQNLCSVKQCIMDEGWEIFTTVLSEMSVSALIVCWSENQMHFVFYETKGSNMANILALVGSYQMYRPFEWELAWYSMLFLKDTSNGTFFFFFFGLFVLNTLLVPPFIYIALSWIWKCFSVFMVCNLIYNCMWHI